MKKRLAVAAFVLAAATPVLAGEVTGSGKPTPVQGGIASSQCSYSGLNDDPGLDGFGMIQNYGMLVRSMGGFDPTFFLHPGNACRG